MGQIYRQTDIAVYPYPPDTVTENYTANDEAVSGVHKNDKDIIPADQALTQVQVPGSQAIRGLTQTQVPGHQTAPV